MHKKGYTLRDMRARNREIYQFYLDNLAKELTYREIGTKYELSGARVFEIIRKEAGKAKELVKE